MDFTDRKTGQHTLLYDLTKDGYIDLAMQCGATELSERFGHYSAIPISENTEDKKSKILTGPPMTYHPNVTPITPVSSPQHTESDVNTTDKTTTYLHIAVASASVTIGKIHVERSIELTSQSIRRKKPVPADQLVQLAGTTALKQAIQTALGIKKGEMDRIARDYLGLKPERSTHVVTVEDAITSNEPDELSPEELAKKEAELMG